VLVNRGGRELPIAPQISAFDTELADSQNLQLLRHENGAFYFTLEENT
jgi:pyrimidine operon attenuation protein/uracil phosphoribosyltransferase